LVLESPLAKSTYSQNILKFEKYFTWTIPEICPIPHKKLPSKGEKQPKRLSLSGGFLVDLTNSAWRILADFYIRSGGFEKNSSGNAMSWTESVTASA
jgi:hypothetical protein